MKVVGLEEIKNAGNGTMFYIIDSRVSELGEDIDSGAEGPFVIVRHTETSAGGHLEAILTLEPWPNQTPEDRYGDGDSEFAPLQVTEADFGENTRFLIFEQNDLCKLMSIVLYAMSDGDNRYLHFMM